MDRDRESEAKKIESQIRKLETLIQKTGDLIEEFAKLDAMAKEGFVDNENK